MFDCPGSGLKSGKMNKKPAEFFDKSGLHKCSVSGQFIEISTKLDFFRPDFQCPVFFQVSLINIRTCQMREFRFPAVHEYLSYL